MTHRALAQATKKVDPSRLGVSTQLIAFLATARSWGRDTTSVRSARLIEDALGVAPWSLFEEVAPDGNRPD